jgi:hypothetical protein
MAVGAIVLVGALDTPLHTGVLIVPRLRAGKPLYARDSVENRGLTPGLQPALTWVRAHVPTGAVLAVNNQYSDPNRRVPTYYYYSAFGERRVFLEGWVDTIAAAGMPSFSITPFPLRYWLNTAVFGAADMAALHVMETRFGVRYLFVDRAHGPDDPHLGRLARAVFSNPSAVIYRVG